MIARTQLTDLLRQHLPDDVQLVPYAAQLDAPNASTVMCRLDTVAPGPAQGLQAYTFALVLIAGTTSTGAGDDELEALLEDVLYAIGKPGPAVTWTPPAARGVYGRAGSETNPSFEVNVTVTFTKTDPPEEE
jgi:hypothetical protein